MIIIITHQPNFSLQVSQQVQEIDRREKVLTVPVKLRLQVSIAHTSFKKIVIKEDKESSEGNQIDYKHGSSCET